MVVTSIIVTTIIVFILVDILLRMFLTRMRAAQTRKEREQALDVGLKLDVSEEAPTLTRVELDSPKARILAVDDEKIILDSLRKMLVLGGYSIDTVESGSEALGLVSKRDYDFVFTDLKMPGMDGVEVTKAVRHLRPDIDVIVITGYGTIETAVETVQYGAMDYVEKPFTEDELLAFVKTALIKRQARQEKQVRHKVRLVKPGIGESKSRFELNVPAGAFISPQHAWARIELNGAVRIGLDDLIRKIFRQVDGVGNAVLAQLRRLQPRHPLTHQRPRHFRQLGACRAPGMAGHQAVRTELDVPHRALGPGCRTAGLEDRARRDRLVPGRTGPLQPAGQERRCGCRRYLERGRERPPGQRRRKAENPGAIRGAVFTGLRVPAGGRPGAPGD